MSQQIVNCERGLLQGLISATFINIATKDRILISFKFTSGINTKDRTQNMDLFGRLNYRFHLFLVESNLWF